VLLAAVFLREIPTLRQGAGIVLAFAGLALIGASSGADLPVVALALALSGALSWAVGNILVKRAGNMPMIPLIVWASLVPPLPAFALSFWLEPATSFPHALAGASWLSIAGLIYLGTLSTVAAYAIWGYLLGRYSAAAITPFALLSPCVGVLASALVFGETFPQIRYGGMALIMLGLVVILLPSNRTTPPIQVPPA
jgi:O-acetylserine/cysteine efflux transporter